jgi:hypothetical protein
VQGLCDALLTGLQDDSEDVEVSTLLVCTAMDVASQTRHLRLLGGPKHYIATLTALLQRTLPRCRGAHPCNVHLLAAVSRALARASFSPEGKAAIVESEAIRALFQVLQMEVEVRTGGNGNCGADIVVEVSKLQ